MFEKFRQFFFFLFFTNNGRAWRPGRRVPRRPSCLPEMSHENEQVKYVMGNRNYQPHTRDQRDMRATRVAAAATRDPGESRDIMLCQKKKQPKGLYLPLWKMQQDIREGVQSVTSQRGGDAHHPAPEGLLPRHAPRSRAGRGAPRQRAGQ